mmetsp:Transcript_67185/g.148873  ORF Transcript_67185/g.148873 Transcript_67185/m.148873 type:complete len:389 (+) Transcript_67185:106-1272(+)
MLQIACCSGLRCRLSSVIVLIVALAFSCVGASEEAMLQAPAVREEVCRFCYRQCSISCFAGTCGLQYGMSVRRYQASNQCFSCDTADSADVSGLGDLRLCSASEAAAVSSSGAGTGPGGGTGPGVGTGPSTVAPALRGPALPGDANEGVKQAAVAAGQAVQSLQAASAQAAKAAAQAVGSYQDCTPGAKEAAAAATSGELRAENMQASVKDAEDMDQKLQMAQAHQLAAQIRAADKLRVSQAAHAAWKAAIAKYNQELVGLRDEQLKVDAAEKIVESTEFTAAEARRAYAQSAKEASQAAKDELLGGEAVATRAETQARAEEVASTARAAQRRLIIATGEAKSALGMTVAAFQPNVAGQKHLLLLGGSQGHLRSGVGAVNPRRRQSPG